MSAGAFTLTKYTANDGVVHQIKVQPETISAVIDGDDNSAIDSPVTSGFAAEVNRGARAYGLRPRKITVAFAATPPTGYRPYTSVTLPVLTKATWLKASVGDTVTYAGGTGIVTSKIPEDLRPGDTALGAAIEPEE